MTPRSAALHTRQEHSASRNDEEVLARVREGLRLVGEEVQCLVEQHASKVRQLIQQVQELKSGGPAKSEDVVQLPGALPTLDSALVLPFGDPPAIDSPFSLTGNGGVMDSMVGFDSAALLLAEATASPPPELATHNGSQDSEFHEIQLPLSAGYSSVVPAGSSQASASATSANCNRDSCSFSDSGMPAIDETKAAEPTENDAKTHDPSRFRKKLLAVLDQAKQNRGEMERRISRSSTSSDNALQTMLPDADSMKQRVRDAISRPEYSVTDFYHKTGICQAIATHPLFEPVTVAVIALNAVWMAIDIDFNTDALLSDAHPVFQIAEHSFCAFFVAEWIVRFLSFRHKRDCMKDSWFVFDTVLAGAFAFEAWFLTIIALVFDLRNSTGFSNVSILRIFRLMRLNRMGRMAHILKALPEMLIVIKGIGAALRSVFFTLVLLTIILYVFGIGFRTLATETKLEDMYFSSVPASMLSLLLAGILPEYEDNVRQIGQVHLAMGLLWGFFMFITTITLMNFLIGVLVEAVSAVAVTEKEALTVKFVKATMHDLLDTSGIDQDGNKHLSKSEFEELLLNPQTASAMQHMGVDVVGLVEFGEVLFQDDNEMSFPDFIRLVLQLRSTNPTTVKDIVDLRKFVLQQLAGLEDYLVSVIQECAPQKKSISRRQGSRKKSIRGVDLDSMLAA